MRQDVKNGNEKKDRSLLIPVLFLVLSAFFIYLFMLPEPGAKTAKERSAEQAQRFEQKVNRHLFQTSQSLELNRQRAALEAARLSGQTVNAGPAIDPEKESHPLDLSTDSRNDSLVKDLDRESKQPSLPKTPSELVQAELFEQEQLAAYSEEYKRAYAQKFIENARQAGYLVKLNDQYKVISVQPLRKPTNQYELFGAGGGAVQ